MREAPATDPSGRVNIEFFSLEYPDGSTVPIDAVAANMNLQAIKGAVTGFIAQDPYLGPLCTLRKRPTLAPQPDFRIAILQNLAEPNLSR